MASPAYSMTWPVPPAVPISPMMARMMSLAVTPGAAVALDEHAHVARLLLHQRLGGQHVLDLRRADAPGQRPEGAVGRGVGIAADDGGAGQGEALLGADHVDDALAAVVLVEILDAEFRDVGGERLDLQPAVGVLDALGAIGRRNVVVDHRQGALGRVDLASGHAQPLEGLGARHLVDQVPIDVEQRRAVRLGLDDVVVPDLVVERARRGHGPVRVVCGFQR